MYSLTTTNVIINKMINLTVYRVEPHLDRIKKITGESSKPLKSVIKIDKKKLFSEAIKGCRVIFTPNLKKVLNTNINNLYNACRFNAIYPITQHVLAQCMCYSETSWIIYGPDLRQKHRSS